MLWSKDQTQFPVQLPIPSSVALYTYIYTYIYIYYIHITLYIMYPRVVAIYTHHTIYHVSQGCCVDPHFTRGVELASLRGHSCEDLIKACALKCHQPPDLSDLSAGERSNCSCLGGDRKFFFWWRVTKPIEIKTIQKKELTYDSWTLIHQPWYINHIKIIHKHEVLDSSTFLWFSMCHVAMFNRYMWNDQRVETNFWICWLERRRKIIQPCCCWRARLQNLLIFQR